MSVICIEDAPNFGRRKSSERTRLSPREIQCVELAHLGNADIGLALGIATDTVRANLRSAFVKLGVSTRTEAYRALVETQERRAA